MLQLIQRPTKRSQIVALTDGTKGFFCAKIFLLELFNIPDYKQKILIHPKSSVSLQNKF